MTRVFFSKKTEQLIKKLEFAQLRKNLQEKIIQNHQDMLHNWKMYALGERIKIKERELKNIDEFPLETRLLGYDFSVALQNGNNDQAIEKIENLRTIWRN